jgi:hypothetical protein
MQSRRKSISIKASSLREVKSLVSGVKTGTCSVWDILIENSKTRTYIFAKDINFWVSENRDIFDEEHKLAKGIYKSGFIKA